MKKRVLKMGILSLIIIIFTLIVYGYYSNKQTEIKIAETNRANATTATYSGKDTKFEQWEYYDYTYAFCNGWHVPYKPNYQVYCIEPDVHIRDAYEMRYSEYKKFANKLKKGKITITMNSDEKTWEKYKATKSVLKRIDSSIKILESPYGWENDNDKDGKYYGKYYDITYSRPRTPVVWNPMKNKQNVDLPNILAYIASAGRTSTKYCQWDEAKTKYIEKDIESGNKWSADKQLAIWKLAASDDMTKKKYSVSSIFTEEQSDDKFKGTNAPNILTEAKEYATYADKIDKYDGLNASILEYKNAKISSYSNGDMKCGPYKISYNYQTIYYTNEKDELKVGTCSGISGIDIHINFEDGTQSTVQPKSVIMDNSEYIIKNGPWNYFNPNANTGIDTSEWNNIDKVLTQGKKFELKFDKQAKQIKSISIKIKFKYMLAEGNYTKYNGVSYSVVSKKNKNGTMVLTERKYRRQDIISMDAVRKTYSEELEIPMPEVSNGRYIIKIKKEDDNGKYVNGAKFKRIINGNANNRTYTTGNENGTVIIVNQKIDKNNLNTTDIIDITEYSVPTGYIKYPGTIRAVITKKTSNNKYVVNGVTVTAINGKDLFTASSSTSPVKYTKSDNNGTTTITITVENPKIESGEFILNLQKISAGTTNSSLHGAIFNIKENKNDTRPDITEETKNGKGTGNYKLLTQTINKAGTYSYDITEKNAPDGYAGFTGKIQVKIDTVVDTINKNNKIKYKYKVNSVTATAYDSDGIPLIGDESPILKPETNSNKTTITLKMTNIQKGSYDLKINKLSSSSDESLPGAKFKIQKATMNSSGTWTWDNGTEISKNANGIYTLKGNVEITEAEPFDCYWITETQAPYGYNKFTGGIRVQVNKKIEKNKAGIQQYMVDNVEITAYGESDPTVNIADRRETKLPDNKNPVTWDTKEATITLKMKNEPQYDLALRKFITSINGIAPKESREPTVDLTTLKNGTFNRNNNNEYTATYKHNKDEEGKVLEAATGDRVVYTIRIYNEGKKDGTATEITDYLPAGLKLVDNSEINTTYGWTNPSKDGKTMVSEYLKDKKIAAFNGTTLAYRDVQIECEVIATKAKDNLKNIAEITADDGKDRDSTPKNVNRGNYGSTSQQDDDDFEVLKFRSTLNLGGTVWLDLRGGKETLANGLKDSDNKDEKGLKGVNVELYQKDDTSPYTDGERIAETTTKDDGTYTFKGLPMDKLYYVKFTYNGQNYENTIYNAQKEKNDTRKKSTATEKKQDRDNFNNGFNINDISDTELKNELGYFEDYNKLTYRNRKNQNISCAISAYTGQQSGKSFAYSLYGRGGVDNVTINTIDFGITKRIEFDMQLKQDVYAATVRVNGKHGIYGYDTIDLSKEDWTLLVDDADLKYERKIADADYNFTGVNEKGDGKLEIYVTYKIAIHNSSMSMLGEVTKIKDYYDKYYTYVPGLSWISSKNYSTNDLNSIEEKILNVVEGNSKEISLTGEEKMVPPVNPINGKDYNILEISLGDNAKKITTGENQYLYLTFKVNEENKYVKLGPKTNKAEIVEYKSYYKKGTKLPYYNYNNDKLTTYEVQNDTTLAGRVDRNSIPNNMNISDGPKENDENEAPVLDVICEGNRRISGSVWEDARNNKVDDSVIGDGTFNDKDDKKIDIVKEGITIELYRAESEGTFKKLEDKPSIEGNRYTFNNVVAGDYIVKFTYGDGTVKYNGQDYKSTIFDDYGKTEHDIHKNGNISRAGDVWDEREKLNNSSKTMKNAKAKSLAENKDCLMAAETKKIVAEIEFGRQVTTENSKTKSNPGYLISGVNLGLVERPKAQLELNKTVSNVKVTLADGSILFDASQGVNVDNVAWQQNTNKNRGLIQLSMDQEIMHGASIQITYKLTVKNVGEVDYEGDQFYYTGKNPGNKVTTTPNTVVDYVSNNLQFNKDNNSNWEIVKLDELYKEENSADNYIDQDVKNKAQKINTIVKTNALNTALEPGKSVDTTLVLTQVITPENKNDNLTYSNIAEIVEVSNTVGRKMAFSIVGNQDPTVDTPGEIDASIAEKILILPPFGNGNIVYYILGAVVGIILIGGIILIIKKVLIIK